MKRRFIATGAKMAAAAVLLTSCFLAQESRAVILMGSGDPSYNTTPPTGALAGSGWQYEGFWGSFLGTPIAPNYFIAAHHVGGSIGQTFTFQGVAYTTTAYWDDPQSDLRIWKVNGTFPAYARLYSTNNETGQTFVVIGRGTQRGEQVIADVAETIYYTNTVDLKSLGIPKKLAQQEFPEATFHGNTMSVVTESVVTNAVPKGWKAGASDGVMRWGQSKVVDANSFIIGSFDKNGGPNQAYLSGGDSSGAVFIQANGGWKLAGINYAVEGPYGLTPTDSEFYAAVYDESGLYSNGIQYPDNGMIRPACFYATKISSRLAWIQSIINQ